MCPPGGVLSPYIYILYFSFYYSWCDVLQDFINLINVDVDVDVP